MLPWGTPRQLLGLEMRVPVGAAEPETVRWESASLVGVILRTGLETLRPCRWAWRVRRSPGARDSVFLDSSFLARASVILNENICLLENSRLFRWPVFVEG